MITEQRPRPYFMRTPRLGFGIWTPEDLPLARALWGDPAVTRLIGGPFSERWIHDRLATEIANQATFGFQYWPLFRLSDEAHVGCCGLRPVPSRDGVLELGFHLRPEHWGQGLATEAARAAIDVAFVELRTTTLVAGHHPENDASRRILTRLGFRFTRSEIYEPTGLQHASYELESSDLRGKSEPRERGGSTGPT